MTVLSFLVPCLGAFVAGIGFAIIYNIHGKNILISSLCGTLAYAVYLVACLFFETNFAPYFIAGVFIGLYSELAAYIFHTPVTVYLMPGIVPLVPGFTIYKTMEACLHGDISGFGTGVVDTLKIAGAISLGMIMASYLVKAIKNIAQRNWKEN